MSDVTATIVNALNLSMTIGITRFVDSDITTKEIVRLVEDYEECDSSINPCTINAALAMISDVIPDGYNPEVLKWIPQYFMEDEEESIFREESTSIYNGRRLTEIGPMSEEYFNQLVSTIDDVVPGVDKAVTYCNILFRNKPFNTDNRVIALLSAIYLIAVETEMVLDITAYAGNLLAIGLADERDLANWGDIVREIFSQCLIE